MKKTILLFAGLAFLTFKNQAQSVTDYDGNVYNTVTIGTQLWMKENLKVTHYRNGTPISNVTSDSLWYEVDDAGTDARCYYDNDSITNASVYGALYNWYAVTNIQKMCPTGWHVPSDSEWNSMEMYLDITVDTSVNNIWTGTDIGSKLKESGTSHWLSGNNSTNSSNFTALPGGYRDYFGAFNMINSFGHFWTSTSYQSSDAWTRYLGYDRSTVSKRYNDKGDGYSVRCVQDPLTTIIDDNSIEGKIQMYPNPAIDMVYINCNERENLKIQIYNIVGECVLQKELSATINEIDIRSLSKGIYVIQITAAEGAILQKLIKN